MSRFAFVALVPLLLLLFAACDDSGVDSPTSEPTDGDVPATTEGTPDVGPVTVILPPDLATALATSLGPPGPADPPTPGPERAPEVAAAEDLGKRLEQPADAFEVVSVTAMDWPDGCLGLGGAREVCAQVITPGFEVLLQLGETVYNYRTNVTGTVARFADVSIGGDES